VIWINAFTIISIFFFKDNRTCRLAIFDKIIGIYFFEIFIKKAMNQIDSRIWTCKEIKK